jgi:hypothetical protein
MSPDVLINVLSLFSPTKFIDLPTTTFSGYVPFFTYTVSPGLAAFTPSEIVVKLQSTPGVPSSSMMMVFAEIFISLSGPIKIRTARFALTKTHMVNTDAMAFLMSSHFFQPDIATWPYQIFDNSHSLDSLRKRKYLLDY